jgi:hypothetical protein
LLTTNVSTRFRGPRQMARHLDWAVRRRRRSRAVRRRRRSRVLGPVGNRSAGRYPALLPTASGPVPWPGARVVGANRVVHCGHPLRLGAVARLAARAAHHHPHHRAHHQHAGHCEREVGHAAEGERHRDGEHQKGRAAPHHLRRVIHQPSVRRPVFVDLRVKAHAARANYASGPRSRPNER